MQLYNIPVDMAVLVALLIIITVIISRSGNTFTSAFGLSLPVGAFMASLIPQSFIIGQIVTKSIYSQIGAFVACVFFSYFFISKILRGIGFSGVGLLQSFGGAFGLLVVMLVLIMHIQGLADVLQFGGMIKGVFVGQYLLYWFAGGMAMLGFFRS